MEGRFDVVLFGPQSCDVSCQTPTRRRTIVVLQLVHLGRGSLGRSFWGRKGIAALYNKFVSVGDALTWSYRLCEDKCKALAQKVLMGHYLSQMYNK
eukprot:1513820-Amphidinium_carterae.1